MGLSCLSCAPLLRDGTQMTTPWEVCQGPGGFSPSHAALASPARPPLRSRVPAERCCTRQLPQQTEWLRHAFARQDRRHGGAARSRMTCRPGSFSPTFRLREFPCLNGRIVIKITRAREADQLRHAMPSVEVLQCRYNGFALGLRMQETHGLFEICIWNINCRLHDYKLAQKGFLVNISCHIRFRFALVGSVVLMNVMTLWWQDLFTRRQAGTRARYPQVLWQGRACGGILAPRSGALPHWPFPSPTPLPLQGY
mgnify:CR=1 FL=1